MTHRSGEADPGRHEDGAGRQQQRALTALLTDAPDVAGPLVVGDESSVAHQTVLATDHGVSAQRHNGSGRNLEGLTVQQLADPVAAGEGPADERPRPRAADSPAVHGGGVERRKVDQRPERLSQYTSHSVPQRQRASRQRPSDVVRERPCRGERDGHTPVSRDPDGRRYTAHVTATQTT